MTYIGTTDVMLKIAKGLVPGHSGVNKFGRNDDSATNTEEVIWTNGGATYPFPSTADITHIRQTVDTAANRGETIEVQGLDTNYDLVTQTVVLDATNSTTPVALTTALRRVFRMYVKGTTALGNDVELRNVGGGTTYAVITAAFGQTQMAVYSVPSGYTAYVVNYFGAVAQVTNKAPSSLTVRMYTQDYGNSYTARLRHEISTTGSHVEHKFAPYLKVPELTDIWLVAFCADDPGSVNGGFDIILVED